MALELRRESTSYTASSGSGSSTWTGEVKQEYIAFIQKRKQLSRTSVHSYCWRLESVFKALMQGTEWQGRTLNKEDIRKLMEEKREDAERIVRQDDRQSHYRLLKEFLGMPEVPMPSLLLSASSHISQVSHDADDHMLQPPKLMGGGAASSYTVMGSTMGEKSWLGNRGKVCDAELNLEYTNWLK